MQWSEMPSKQNALVFTKSKTPISTNLYGSLWFGTNDRVLLRRRCPTIKSSVPPVTTTKGEGYYVEFFLIHAFPLE